MNNIKFLSTSKPDAYGDYRIEFQCGSDKWEFSFCCSWIDGGYGSDIFCNWIECNGNEVEHSDLSATSKIGVRTLCKEFITEYYDDSKQSSKSKSLQVCVSEKLLQEMKYRIAGGNIDKFLRKLQPNVPTAISQNLYDEIHRWLEGVKQVRPDDEANNFILDNFKAI